MIARHAQPTHPMHRMALIMTHLIPLVLFYVGFPSYTHTHTHSEIDDPLN